MKEVFQEVSGLMVLKFTLSGCLLFLALRIFHKGLTAAIISKKMNPGIIRLFPVAEFTVWVLFLFWGTRQIFETGVAGSLLFLVLIMVLFLWAGNFAVRDWTAGIIFKTEGRYRVNDSISYRNTRGRLTHLGHRSLTLESSDGRSLEIPYSTIVREAAIEKYPGKTACTTVKLSIPAETPFPELQKGLREIILCAPWCSIVHLPEIRLREELEGNYCVDLTVYMIDESFAAETETYIRNFLRSWQSIDQH